MEFRLHYVLLGGFLVVTLVMLVVFGFWMRKYDRNAGAYMEYYLYNKELPNGIRIETPVRYLGIPVGFVKGYDLGQMQDGVEIVIWVKTEILLREGTRAVVESQGLTGGNYIALVQGSGEVFAKDEKSVIAFEENWIERIGNKTGAVFDRLEVSLDRLNVLLSEKNLRNIEVALQNIKQTSMEFGVAIDGINGAFKSAKRAMEGIEKSSALLDMSLQRGDYNLRAILTPFLFQLEQNSKQLGRVLRSIEDVVEEFSRAPGGFLLKEQQEALGPRE